MDFWNIHETLSYFIFHPNWITNLTSSPFFSILVNGSPSNTFNPFYDIRQGDPLSPFLFILMDQVLRRIKKVEIKEGNLRGLPLHGLDPPTSHTQFVNDTMLL